MIELLFRRKNMKSIKGTKTAVNLMKSFIGETQAAIRYEYYGAQAKKMVMFKFKIYF